MGCCRCSIIDTNTATTRAFADDTAMVMQSWCRDTLRVFGAFKTFALVSGLVLNFAKTVAMPLWDEDPRCNAT
eukprot:3754005-Pyramimonas_sp.AAC.1